MHYAEKLKNKRKITNEKIKLLKLFIKTIGYLSDNNKHNKHPLVIFLRFYIIIFFLF